MMRPAWFSRRLSTGPRCQSDMVGMEKQDRFVSDESQGKRCVLKFTYQMNHHIVTEWDDMEKNLTLAIDGSGGCRVVSL